jgi:hypothetical protein
VDAYAEIIATRPLGIGGILLYTNGCGVAKFWALLPTNLSRGDEYGGTLQFVIGRPQPPHTRIDTYLDISKRESGEASVVRLRTHEEVSQRLASMNNTPCLQDTRPSVDCKQAAGGLDRNRELNAKGLSCALYMNWWKEFSHGNKGRMFGSKIVVLFVSNRQKTKRAVTLRPIRALLKVLVRIYNGQAHSRSA